MDGTRPVDCELWSISATHHQTTTTVSSRARGSIRLEIHKSRLPRCRTTVRRALRTRARSHEKCVSARAARARTNAKHHQRMKQPRGPRRTQATPEQGTPHSTRDTRPTHSHEHSAGSSPSSAVPAGTRISRSYKHVSPLVPFEALRRSRIKAGELLPDGASKPSKHCHGVAGGLILRQRDQLLDARLWAQR